MFDQQKFYQVALNLVTGVGDLTSRSLISYCGSAEEVFRSNRKKLLRVPGIGEKTARLILEKSSFDKAESILAKCKQSNIQIYHFTDSSYPSRLKQLADAPTLLYFTGHAELNARRTVAVVGTRQVTSYGKTVIEEMVRDLIPYDCLIISGLAYGVDIHAHKMALKHQMPTVAVIAGGLNCIYPSVHKEIARKMTESGGILSEHPPDVIPESHQFPERNRIIAGLADVTIIIETSIHGGAMITAEYANNYNREIFAVPGNINNPFSTGCNRLIRNHKAHIFTSVKDIEYLMNWDLLKKNQPQEPDISGLDESEIGIVTILKNNHNEMQIDELSWKTQIPVNKLAGLLLSLEFKGVLKALPGKRFKLTI